MIGKLSLEDLIESFKANIRNRIKTSLVFDGDDTVVLDADPRTYAEIGYANVPGMKHSRPKVEV